MTGTVLPDANVLFSRTLRDWLFLLSSGGELYTVHSTPDILAETLSRYRDRFPHVTGEEVDRLATHLSQQLRIPIAGSRHHLKADANSLGVAPDTEPALAPRSANPS